MNMVSTKSEQRTRLREKRQRLNPDYVKRASDDLCKQLMSLIEWDKCKYLHCFLPLENDNEPDIRPVIQYAIEKGVVVYTSDPSPSTGRKVKPLINQSKQEKIIQFQINNNEIVFDYIIVPMLGFNLANKHRLGFGGGFYDRLLASQPTAKSIGVVFKEFEIIDLVPETHDMPLSELLIA